VISQAAIETLVRAARVTLPLSILTVSLAVGGCAGDRTAGPSSGGAGPHSLNELTSGALDAVTQHVAPLFKTGQVRSLDRYCESVEESYEVTDNVLRLAAASGIQSLVSWQRNGYQVTSQNTKELTGVVKEISKQYVWMPVPIEQQIGAELSQEYPADKIVERSQRRRERTMYAHVDEALALAKKDYPKLPYELTLSIVDSDVINAEALPAGHIFVTRKAATDLDRDALRLVLGHEVAHVAKRHTSKQIQQRIVDVGLGVDMLKHVAQSRSAPVDAKVFSSWRLVDRLEGVFARYDQNQELQADACSIRSLVYAGVDPIKARQDYLRKRGVEVSKVAHPAGAPRAFGAGFTDHPDDEARERFFREATNFHRMHAQSGTASPRETPPSLPTPSTQAGAQAAPVGCGKIEIDRSVRGDGEPLFTKMPDRDRRRLQTAICLKGKDVDGVWGPRTKYALKQYECRMDHEPDGKLTDALVADLLKLAPDEVMKRCQAE
jgi:peptidase M48-like protein